MILRSKIIENNNTVAVNMMSGTGKYLEVSFHFPIDNDLDQFVGISFLI